MASTLLIDGWSTPNALSRILSAPARTRLYREAQALGKLSHPNVVAVHDVGTHRGQVWVAMEFVVGQTFGAWVLGARPPWRRVVEVIKQAARGVAAAHRAGLLHRDLKPDNIMIGNDGRVRVMDFGLARRQGPRSTPSSSSPRRWVRSTLGLRTRSCESARASRRRASMSRRRRASSGRS